MPLLIFDRINQQRICVSLISEIIFMQKEREIKHISQIYSTVNICNGISKN